jgi:membrane protein
MHIRQHLQAWKIAGLDFVADDAMTLGAALAFYTALSLAPLLVLILWAVSFLGESSRQGVVARIEQTVGPQAGQAIGMIISASSQQQDLRSVAGLLGFVALFFSASGVFGQLQAALNRIWDVPPKTGMGIWGWIRKRMLSMGMIVAIAFVMMVSLVASALVTFIFGPAWSWADLVTSMIAYVLLFAVIYKVLPDVQIEWRDVWFGSAVTAVMFAVGKWLIGWYLGSSSVGSAYGAAGSLVLLLVWVYYSSLILFVGAEVTQAYARVKRQAAQPNPAAVATATEEKPAS